MYLLEIYLQTCLVCSVDIKIGHLRVYFVTNFGLKSFKLYARVATTDGFMLN